MQSAIFSNLASCHRHLEFNVSSSVAISDLEACFSIDNDRVRLVFGFGHRLWLQLADTAPDQLKPFSDIGQARSTQADIWVWVSGDDHSEVLDAAAQLVSALQKVAELVAEVEGQPYHQSRDRIGFEDGTANPKTDDARKDAALIPLGQVGAGGSYALTQQWLHKLPKFQSLPLPEQEAVVGRTKADSIELEGDAMPANSHVSRTDAKVDGVAQKIWRRSIPWGGVQKNGLYFVGFACELSRLEIQLQRMYGLTDDGVKDRLTEFSTAIRSSWWFVPCDEALAELTAKD